MKKYYEIVFEGHYKAIWGLLEGFMLGKNKRWSFFFSEKAGIKTETLTEAMLEWITLKNKLHHVIIESEMFDEMFSLLEARNDLEFVQNKYVKSAQIIKEAGFRFSARTYGKKYGDEIENLIKNLPEDLEITDYNPEITEHKGVNPADMYAPDHEYIYEASGKITGDIKQLIKFRKILDEHPLVDVKQIKLKF